MAEDTEFCHECGAPTTGNFCSNCGAERHHSISQMHIHKIRVWYRFGLSLFNSISTILIKPNAYTKNWSDRPVETQTSPKATLIIVATLITVANLVLKHLPDSTSGKGSLIASDIPEFSLFGLNYDRFIPHAIFQDPSSYVEKRDYLTGLLLILYAYMLSATLWLVNLSSKRDHRKYDIAAGFTSLIATLSITIPLSLLYYWKDYSVIILALVIALATHAFFHFKYTYGYSGWQFYLRFPVLLALSVIVFFLYYTLCKILAVLIASGMAPFE